MSTLNEFRNADDTSNGAKLLAAMSSLDEREIAWMAARLKQLIVDERVPKAEAKRIVAQEGKDKPWLQP